MKKIKIGGVPEHFNLAWYLTLKKGAYKKENINLRWQDYPGGTGAMCKALRHKDIDLAVILSEGIIKDIIAGNPSSIIQTFVQSSLIWGIHTAAQSNYKSISDLKGTKAAISRFGSGSHLMTYLNAKHHHWNLKTDLKFEVVNNLEGAVEGLTNCKADYFMWEKFTTKPLVDQHIFNRIGVYETPWPCFVIAVRNDFLQDNKEDVQTILRIINTETKAFKTIPDIDKTIAERYNQKLEDVQEWLSITEWSQKVIEEETVQNIQNQLFALAIIPEIWEYNRIVTPL